MAVYLQHINPLINDKRSSSDMLLSCLTLLLRLSSISVVSNSHCFIFVYEFLEVYSSLSLPSLVKVHSVLLISTQVIPWATQNLACMKFCF